MLKRAAATSLVPLALLVACASAPKPSETPSGCDPALWRRASQLHHAATVVDTHTDTTSRILDEGFDMGPRAPDGHMDLPRIREGGLDVAFYSIYVASRFYGDEAPLFAKKPGDDDWPRPPDAGTANGSARRAMAMHRRHCAGRAPTTARPRPGPRPCHEQTPCPAGSMAQGPTAP